MSEAISASPLAKSQLALSGVSTSDAKKDKMNYYNLESFIVYLKFILTESLVVKKDTFH